MVMWPLENSRQTARMDPSLIAANRYLIITDKLFSNAGMRGGVIITDKLFSNAGMRGGVIQR